MSTHPTMDDLFRQRAEMTTADRAQDAKERRMLKLVGRMRHLHGHGPAGVTCGQCRHLLAMQYQHVYYKCALGPQSSSAATDWRKGWAACGKFEEWSERR